MENEGMIYVVNLEELSNTASEILKTNKTKIFCFYGDMGAGKTTIIKHFCRILGYEKEVQSPTFSIINEYSNANVNIHHMDLYRLENEFQLVDLGIEEYIYGNSYCFIEWPQLIENILYEPYCKIKISVLEEQKRKLEVKMIQ